MHQHSVAAERPLRHTCSKGLVLPMGHLRMHAAVEQCYQQTTQASYLVLLRGQSGQLICAAQRPEQHPAPAVLGCGRPCMHECSSCLVLFGVQHVGLHWLVCVLQTLLRRTCSSHTGLLGHQPSTDLRA